MATTIVTKSGSGAPTASDLVAGELAVDLTNKRLYTENSGGTVLELGTNPSGDITFGDNGKAIFGAGSDLQIYHDGNHSYIEDAGTGSIKIKVGDFRVENASGNNLIKGVGNVATLHHDGSEKLATTATGIDVTGSVTASGNIIPTGGSATAGSIWKSGANLLISMDTGGLYVNNSANTISAFHITDAGNVGIGTSSPFSVNGTNLEVSDALYSRLILDSTAGTRYSIQSLNDSSLGIYDLDADSERLRIDSLGNASFNTTDIAPASNNVFGTAILQYGGASMSRTNSTTLDLNRSSSDGAIVNFRKDGAAVGSIGNSGSTALYVGSGDTQLLFKADEDQMVPFSAGAYRDDAISLGRSNSRFKDLYLSGNAIADNFVGTNDTDTFIAMTGSNVMRFYNGGSEAMRIDANGKLLVGTTAGSFGARITAESTTSYTFESRRTGTGSEGHVVFKNGNGAVGTIFTNGSATVYNTSSDQRLKENIADADDAGDLIDAIQVRSFDWKADGEHQKYGMVAQELLEVAPEAVSAPEDPEEMMGVDYSKLVPMMLKEIQSLRARIAALES